MSIFKKTSFGIVIALMSIAGLTAMKYESQDLAEASKQLELAVKQNETQKALEILQANERAGAARFAGKYPRNTKFPRSFLSGLLWDAAITNNNKEMVRALYEAGAEINHHFPQHQWGITSIYTVLDAAIKRRNQDMINFLESLGATHGSSMDAEYFPDMINFLGQLRHSTLKPTIDPEL